MLLLESFGEVNRLPWCHLHADDKTSPKSGGSDHLRGTSRGYTSTNPPYPVCGQSVLLWWLVLHHCFMLNARWCLVVSLVEGYGRWSARGGS